MIARYDVGEFVASFDFYDWLVMVQALGATQIVFDIDSPKTTKWPRDVVLKRFNSIIEPGPALAGLPYRLGRDGSTIVSPHMRELVRFCKAGRKFRRLKSVKPKGDAKYTVTLRHEPRIPQRNSNDAAWRAFAKEIDAVVIEDYGITPIHLHDRLALYAGAEQNFGVTNGPVHLITLTEYPVMMFVGAAAGGFINCGVQQGEQYPWNLPHQRLIWDCDDLDVLMKSFSEWKRA